MINGEFDTNTLRTNGELQIGNPSGTGYAFPTIDGNINQILATDGSGSLSWTAASSIFTPSANNGLNIYGSTVQLGGALVEDTRYNLSGTGDFIIQDART